MKSGPVASFLYDVFKGEYADVKNIRRIPNTYRIRPTKHLIGDGPLSSSDIEAIDFAVRNFAGFKGVELRDITHAYPEWACYEKRFSRNKEGAEPMFIESFLKNAPPDHRFFVKHGIRDPFVPIDTRERRKLLAEMRATSGRLV